VTDPVDRFLDLLRRASVELYDDNPGRMNSHELLPTANVIDAGDVELFFRGHEFGLISLHRGGRFNTLDRPTGCGRWALLSRSTKGGWYNAEYLPQLAAYVDAIVNLGYPSERVLFELPSSALQLDLAIVDDDSRVVILGEAKRDVRALSTLRNGLLQRFADLEPGDESKKRGDEQRQLAWRLWTVRPSIAWLIGPGHREAFTSEVSPLRLTALAGLPHADELGLAHRPPRHLPPPVLA
jgi:hypothetical protein